MVLTDHDLVDLIAENPQMGLDLGDAFGSRLALLDRFLVERRLRQVPSLAGLSDSLLQAIAHHLSPVTRRRGQAILQKQVDGRTPETAAVFCVRAGLPAVGGVNGLVRVGSRA